MLDRRWRSRPLAADALSAFVEKQRGVAGPRMEPVRLLATSASFWLYSGSDADSIACMRRLVAMARVMVDAEGMPATSDRRADRRRQPLTGFRRVGAGEAPRLPVTLVALDTKKVIAGPDGAAGESSPQPAAIAITISRRERRIVHRLFVDTQFRRSRGAYAVPVATRGLRALATISTRQFFRSRAAYAEGGKIGLRMSFADLFDARCVYYFSVTVVVVSRVGGTPQKQPMGCRLVIVLVAAALWSSGSIRSRARRTARRSDGIDLLRRSTAATKTSWAGQPRPPSMKPSRRPAAVELPAGQRGAR